MYLGTCCPDLLGMIRNDSSLPPEDVGYSFFQNSGIYLLNFMASHRWRLQLYIHHFENIKSHISGLLDQNTTYIVCNLVNTMCICVTIYEWQTLWVPCVLGFHDRQVSTLVQSNVFHTKNQRSWHVMQCKVIQSLPIRHFCHYWMLHIMSAFTEAHSWGMKCWPARLVTVSGNLTGMNIWQYCGNSNNIFVHS
jgi:hypothetical protein